MSANEPREPRDAYDEAIALAQQGKYQEALQKHLWYHEHALEYDTSAAGVRLSFALLDWIQLGEIYPPARAALIQVRDRKTQSFGDGQGTPNLFTDIAAINHYLDQETKTADLFLFLHRSNLPLARRCYPKAEVGLTLLQEYQLCSAYIADPVARFEDMSEFRRLLLDKAQERGESESRTARARRCAEERFEADVGRLVKILLGAGRVAEAERVRELARAETGREIQF